MYAALIDSISAEPRYGDLPAPAVGDGEVLIDMLASSLNPIDLAVAAGTFFGGHPDYPYAPGIEAVGRVTDSGELVFAMGSGLGVSRSGTAAQQFTARVDSLISLPADAYPPVAAALGTAGLAAWLSLAWKAELSPGETVLVLGATGTVGMIAIQAARRLGAARVIAVGRDPVRLKAAARHADVAVALVDGKVTPEVIEACTPGADVVLDALWGTPLESALAAARPGARIVHLGASAGQSVSLPSSAIRGRQLQLLGYSNFAVPRQDLLDGYSTLLAHAANGSIALDIVELPLDECAAAWEVLRGGSRKVVMVPPR